MSDNDDELLPSLVDFLRARIDEDEAMIDAVRTERHDVRHDQASSFAVWAEFDSSEPHVAIGHDRALADCDANRSIVDEHETIRAAYPGTTIESDPCCRRCSAGGEYPGEFPCMTLRLLALPYSTHPDYRDEWRP